MKGLAIVSLTTLLGLACGGLLPGLSRGGGEWRQLVAPPEPAIEILGRDKSSGRTTYLRTEGGVYTCERDGEYARPCSEVAPQQMPEPEELCDPVGSSVRQAPGTVADSLLVVCRGADVTIRFDLVLLTDGRAFEWGQASSWLDVVDVIGYGFIGGVVGLLGGAIIVVARSTCMKRRDNVSQRRTSHSLPNAE